MEEEMRFAVALAVLATAVLAACGGEDSGTDEGAAVESSAAEGAPEGQKPASDDSEGPAGVSVSGDGGGASAKGITIATGDSQFGEILFDGDQRAIYLFDKESTAESECYGACAEAWPPVLTEGEPQAADAVESGLLGTTGRDDGTTQVTYDGQPLYYYVDDPPGEVLCHKVEEFGGLWLVLGADGAALS
jgi:predicted lipoprotein with Yx(FWY)xxD motif